MVSVLPTHLKKQHHVLRNAIKFAVVISTLLFVLFTTQTSIPVGKPLQTKSTEFSRYNPRSIFANETNFPNGTKPSNETENDEGCNVRAHEFYSRCAYVRNDTDCNSNPYILAQWCQFINIQWLFYILMILFVLILFYMLGDTAETYFTPSLIKISDYLRLSPNIAGVTLLALGNGAPDLITIVVGVFKGSAELGFGIPIGGGTFVTTFVFGVVTLASNVKVTRRPYIRDVFMYLVSVSYCFYLFMDNKIKVWESAILLVIYIIYVLIVIFGRAINQFIKRRRVARDDRLLKEEKEKQRRFAINNKEARVNLIDSPPVSPADLYSDRELFSQHSVQDPDVQIKDIDTENDLLTDDDDSDQEEYIGWNKQMAKFIDTHVDQQNQGNQAPQGLIARSSTKFFLPAFKPHRHDSVVSIPENQQSTLVIKDYFTEQNDTQYQYYTQEDQMNQEEDEQESKYRIVRALHRLSDATGWSDMKWYERIFFLVVGWYCTLFRNLTIPRSEEENWNRYFACCIPTFAPFLIFVATGYVDYMIKDKFPMVVIFIIVGMVLSIVMLITTTNRKPPRYQPLLVCVAFAMSIVWIYLIAGNLVNVLSALGEAWGIDKAILAVTVLSWGNSLGDMVSDVVIARQGYPSMAVGAIFGGPMMNLLLGLGFAVTASLIIPVVKPGVCFPVKPDPIVSVSFVTLLISLVSSLFVVPICGFRSRKLYGVFLILLYLVSLLLSLLSSLEPNTKKAFTWGIGRGCW
ncbi:13 TM domain-containing transmembrane protein [Acrasis kona]|uniref:13 TM domain-containing transmembrane protein n=1 Tax=Acrasis kona TaxID=1008807 RepID=A0AAW2ZSI2_9EUKA